MTTEEETTESDYMNAQRHVALFLHEMLEKGYDPESLFTASYMATNKTARMVSLDEHYNFVKAVGEMNGLYLSDYEKIFKENGLSL